MGENFHEPAWQAIRELAGGGDDDKYGDQAKPSWNLMTICTVGGVLFFNAVTRQLDAAAHGNKQSKELLETVYRELTVLGIVAFVLWSISFSPELALTYNNKHFFEVIHMTLFLAAIFHSFFVVLVSVYSNQVSKRWDVYEDDEMKKYKELKQQHRRTAQALGLRHSTLKRGLGPLRQIWLFIRHPVLSRRLWQLSENVSYHALRSHFIKANQLPRNFRFAGYLKKCEQEVVLEMAEVKESVWVGFILAVGLELYIKGIMGNAEDKDDVRVLFPIIAALVMLSALAVHFKLEKIYRALLYSYTTNTERRDDFMQFLSPDSGALLRQQDMFWLGKPELMLIALQSMQFLLAIMVAVLIWFGVPESNNLVIVAEVLLCLGALIVYSIVLPRFLPAFTMVTHVGEMVDRHILSEALQKQKKAFRRRTLPPTLRQVSLLARMKTKERESRSGVGWVRFVFSQHLFRECMQVFLSIHFFLVAYNTDAIENGDFRKDAYTAECVFAGVALFIELSTHAIGWRGALCCTGKCSYEVPDSPNIAASSIYPSSAHRAERMKEGKGLNASMHSESVAWRNSDSFRKRHFAGATRHWSIWAFFGATSDRRGVHDVVPKEAAVGFWRSVDALLVMAVAGTTIATGLTSGSTRVVCHALQGLVILRLIPLHLCPLPSSHGEDDEHAVEHHPLDKKERQEVLEETLKLLRGQHDHAGAHGDGHAPAAGNELRESGANGDHATGVDGVLVASAVLPRPNDTRKLGSTAPLGAIGGEEKNDLGEVTYGSRHYGGYRTEEIAKVGVAMALREACTAHPEVVTSHGPLSAPILRAMLGLDPYQTGDRDNHEAFAIAAQAMTIGIPGGSLGGGRDLDMVVAPPSPPSSSSSSEESSPESRRGRQRSGVSIRTGRLPSWLGGGRARDEAPPPNAFEMTDEEDETPANGVEAGVWKWTGPSDLEVARATDADGEGVESVPVNERSDSYLGPLVSTAGEPRVWSGHPKDVRKKGDGLIHQTTWHSASARSQASRGSLHRPRMNSAGAMAASGVGTMDPSSRVLHHSMHRPKHRHSAPRKGSAGGDPRAAAGAGMMASAKEDVERPVLSSFASSSGWTGGWSPSHGHGSSAVGASGGIPYSSYHRPSEAVSQVLVRTASGRSSRALTPSGVIRATAAARVGPPQRSTSDLGTATTAATPVATFASISSTSGTTARSEDPPQQIQ